MKQLLIMGLVLFLLFALASCGESHSNPTETTKATEPFTLDPEKVFVTPVYDELGFASPEEFIEAYKLVRAGKADRELAEQAETVNFAELEKLYLPIRIPEPYRLYWLSVMKGPTVSVLYYREEHLVSDYERALAGSQYFSYTYKQGDSLMDGIMQQNNAIEEDLIEGKYLLSEPCTLWWYIDGRNISLTLPASADVYAGEISVVEYLGLGSVEELAQFAELEVIDLTELVE